MNEAVPMRPTASSLKSLRECANISEALVHPELMQRLTQAVPRHLSPERFLRITVLAIQKTPKLAKAPMIELLGAMLTLASLGLEPNTPLGHAYLIPFDKNRKDERTGQWVYDRTTIQVIIGYKGYIELARRSADFISIHADVVYEGDDFSFEYGSNMHLRHVPKGDNEDRRPLYAYAHASLRDGGQAFEVLPIARVERVRDNSEGYKTAVRNKDKYPKSYDSTPWVAHFHEMAAKTMVRRIAKMLPLSIEFANAAALDAMSEGGRANWAAIADATNLAAPDLALLADYGEAGAFDADGGPAPDEKKPDAPKQESGDGAKTQNKGAGSTQGDSGADARGKAASDAQGQEGEEIDPLEGERPADDGLVDDITLNSGGEDGGPADSEGGDQGAPAGKIADDPNIGRFETGVLRIIPPIADDGKATDWPSVVKSFKRIVDDISLSENDIKAIMLSNAPLMQTMAKLDPPSASLVEHMIKKVWKGYSLPKAK